MIRPLEIHAGKIHAKKSDMKPPGETQLRIVWFALTTFAIALTVALIAGAVWGIGKFLNLLGPVIWPLAIAVVIAYLFDPLVNWLERRGVVRTWGITIVFVVVFCGFSGILASVIPQMAKETHKLIQKIPQYRTWVERRYFEWADRASNAASSALTKQNTNAPPANASSTSTNSAQSSA
ncbi:MAG: AI-2E family transporter, partial [Limisphaerales bacterium]